MSGFMMMTMNNQRFVSVASGPPPPVVTLGRTNNFDAATYSGTGNWLPTPDSVFVEDITTNAKMRYSSTFGGGSFEFASPDFNTSFNGIGLGTTAGSEDVLTELSVEVWYFRIPSTTTTGIYIRNSDTGNEFPPPRWELSDSCEVNNQGDPQESSGLLNIYQYLVPGAWNQIVMSFGSGTYVKAYVNGALVATSPYVSPVSPDQCTGPTTISAGEGSIAIIRAYNRIITDAEVLQNYNAVKARFVYTLPASVVTTGLVNYLDAAPSGVSPTKYAGVGYDSSGVWRDQVGTADMTLMGSPAYDSSDFGGKFTFVAASSQYAYSSGYAGLPLTDNMTVEVWFCAGTTLVSLTVPLFTLRVDNNNLPLILRNQAAGTANYNRINASYRFGGSYTNTGVTSSLTSGDVWYQMIIRKSGGYGGTLTKSIRSTNLPSNFSLSTNYLYPNTSDTAQIYLMTDFGTNKRNGYMAIVRIYNTALTNAEILQNYNATKARFGLS